MVVLSRFVQAVETRFELGLGDVDISTIFADGDGVVVGVDGRGKIFKCRLHLGEQDGEARVFGRLIDGAVEEGDEIGLALVTDGIECGLLRGVRILGEGGDEGDVLVERALVVAQARERGDEAATQQRRVLLARVGRELCRMDCIELGQIELLQRGIVSGARIALGYYVDVTRVVRRLRQQAVCDAAGLVVVRRVVGFLRGFELELRRVLVIGHAGGVEQRGDCALGLCGATVEISCGSNHSEDAGVGCMDRLDQALSIGDIFARLVGTGKRVLQLKLLHGIGRQHNLPFERMLLDGDEGGGLRLRLGEGSDGRGLVGCGGEGDGLLEHGRQLGLAMLCQEHVRTQRDGGEEQGIVLDQMRLGDGRRGLIDQGSGVAAMREMEQTVARLAAILTAGVLVSLAGIRLWRRLSVVGGDGRSWRECIP